MAFLLPPHPSLFVLLLFSLRKFFIFKWAWAALPTPCFYGPEPELQLSLAVENESQVCHASCLHEVDPG